MLKNHLFLSRRATRTTELLSLWLTEKQQPQSHEQQNIEQDILVELHLLFTNITFFRLGVRFFLFFKVLLFVLVFVLVRIFIRIRLAIV